MTLTNLATMLVNEDVEDAVTHWGLEACQQTDGFYDHKGLSRQCME